MSKIEFVYLSEIDYQTALNIQKNKVEELKGGSCYDYLLFLEHRDVITIGRRGKRDEILVSEEILKMEGIEVIETDRGGSLTAHGPGQLVIYSIFNLARLNISVKDLIFKITDAIQKWIAIQGLNAVFEIDRPGLYVRGKKILSIGLKLDSHITYHGFALNLNSVPIGFNYIVPCSLKNCQMTSLYLETFRKYDIKEVSCELYRGIIRNFNQ